MGIPHRPSQICLKAYHFDRRLYSSIEHFRVPPERYYCSNALRSLYSAFSMAQTRKQRILGDVKKKRRQRGLISIVIVVVLIGVVVTAVALLPRSATNFPFPCLGVESTTLHVHPWLRINITGQSVPIPAAVGISTPVFGSTGVATGGGCFEPLHTHDASGIIHIEASDINSQYSLGDFFKVWAATYNSIIVNGTPHPIVFNNTDIFGFNAGSGNKVTLIVDGTASTLSDYSSLVLKMYDYCSVSNSSVPPCSPTAGGNPFYGGQNYPYGTGHTIVINYGP